MTANELGNQYFQDYIFLRTSGPSCKRPFKLFDPDKLFLQKMFDYDYMISVYNETGLSNYELQRDFCDMILRSKFYRNKDISIGIYHQTIMFYDGQHYIKTDNFNKPEWYFCL